MSGILTEAEHELGDLKSWRTASNLAGLELGYADVPRRRTKMAMTSQSTAPGMPEATNTTQSDVIHHSGPWKMNDQEKATTKATATM